MWRVSHVSMSSYDVRVKHPRILCGGLRSDPTCHRRTNEGNCETSLSKLRNGRLKEAESPGYGSPQNERDASLIPLRFGDQQRREHVTRKRLIAHVCPGN